MTRLYVIRNARTEDGVGFIENPGLDDIGTLQAEGVADLLGSQPAMPLYASPQRRALETAQPLARRWLTTTTVDEALTLMPLPAPNGCTCAHWLQHFMNSTWQDALPFQQAWRTTCLSRLGGLQRDSVIITHYIVVNMIVGAATNDNRTTVFQPDNASITILDAEDGALRLVELGRQAATRAL